MAEVANRFFMCKKKPPLEAAFLRIGFLGGFFGRFPIIKLFFDFLYISFYILHRVFDACYLRQNVCGTVGFSGEVDGVQIYFSFPDMKGIGGECACFCFDGHVVEVERFVFVMECAADFPERN